MARGVRPLVPEPESEGHRVAPAGLDREDLLQRPLTRFADTMRGASPLDARRPLQGIREYVVRLAVHSSNRPSPSFPIEAGAIVLSSHATIRSPKRAETEWAHGSAQLPQRATNPLTSTCTNGP